MERSDKILVAVDDTEASLKAVTYVAQMVRGRDPIYICLFHVLPPIPPRLLEFGGAEDPQKEQILSAELKAAQFEWIEKAKDSAGPSLKIAHMILGDHGVSQDRISIYFSSPIHKPNVVREVLEAANQRHCGTVVVGRHRLPWVQELFHQHTGKGLVEKGQECSVWVIG
jgi:nucleotide-binding universal stress UspA family protein